MKISDYTGKPIVWYNFHNFPTSKTFEDQLSVLLQFLKENFGLVARFGSTGSTRSTIGWDFELAGFNQKTGGPCAPWHKTAYARERLILLLKEGQQYHRRYPSLMFLVGSGNIGEETGHLHLHRLLRLYNWWFTDGQITSTWGIPKPVVIPVWLTPSEEKPISWTAGIPLRTITDDVIQAIFLGCRYSDVYGLSWEKVVNIVTTILPEQEHQEERVCSTLQYLLRKGIVQGQLSLAPLRANQGESDEKQPAD